MSLRCNLWGVFLGICERLNVFSSFSPRRFLNERANAILKAAHFKNRLNLWDPNPLIIGSVWLAYVATSRLISGSRSLISMSVKSRNVRSNLLKSAPWNHREFLGSKGVLPRVAISARLSFESSNLHWAGFSKTSHDFDANFHIYIELLTFAVNVT